YVHRRSGESFEVREFGAGKSSIAFSYRVGGRGKDIRGFNRFARFDAPQPRPAAAAPRKPTAAGLRAFVARVEEEARRRRPKVAKKGKRSRMLPSYLRALKPMSG